MSLSRDKKILQCAQFGSLNDFKKFWKSGENQPKSVTNLKTPLHLASYHNNYKICKFILEEICQNKTSENLTKSLLNPIDFEGNTPLHSACLSKEENLDVAQLLINYCQDINTKNNAGFTPLHLAIISKYEDISHCILEKIMENSTEGNTIFHFASTSGDVLLFQFLLGRNEINKNFQNENGDTPLHLAVKEGHVNICQLLFLGSNSLEMLQITVFCHFCLIVHFKGKKDSRDSSLRALKKELQGTQLLIKFQKYSLGIRRELYLIKSQKAEHLSPSQQ